jgi:hypothetical protein
MFFLSVNIERFQQDGSQLFCSNPVVNGSQAILADIQAYNIFFRIYFCCVTIFSGQQPNRDRDGAESNATAPS